MAWLASATASTLARPPNIRTGARETRQLNSVPRARPLGEELTAESAESAEGKRGKG